MPSRPGAPVAVAVNAGDGKREHPTQALLDLFTMRQQLGDDLAGRSVWIVGDVAHSRVARSLIRILVLTGVHVTVCGPPTLIPHDIAAMGCDVTFDISGIKDADVVYTLRLQHERMTAAAGVFRTTARDRLAGGGHARDLDGASQPDNPVSPESGTSPLRRARSGSPIRARS